MAITREARKEEGGSIAVSEKRATQRQQESEAPEEPARSRYGHTGVFVSQRTEVSEALHRGWQGEQRSHHYD